MAGGPLISRPLRRVLAALRLGGFLLLAAGCAPKAPRLPILEPGGAGVATLLAALAQTPRAPDLTADLELLVQGQGQRAARMNGALRVAWPDRVRLQARLGALFPVASLVVRADSSFLLLPRAKGYWSGATASSRVGGVAAMADGVLWLLNPEPRLAELEDAILDRTRAGPRLRGRLPGDPPVWVTAQFAGDALEIREVVVHGDRGDVWLRGTRRGRQRIEEASLPRSVRLEIMDPPYLIEAQILRPRRDRGAGPETFRLARPPGARWLESDALLPLLGTQGARR